MPARVFGCLKQDLQDEQDFQDEESPVVGNLFLGRSNLPVAMFTERALNKRCVPYPVNPENPASDNHCLSSPENVSGGCGGRLLTLFNTPAPAVTLKPATPHRAAGNRGVGLDNSIDRGIHYL